METEKEERRRKRREEKERIRQEKSENRAKAKAIKKNKVPIQCICPLCNGGYTMTFTLRQMRQFIKTAKLVSDEDIEKFRTKKNED